MDAVELLRGKIKCSRGELFHSVIVGLIRLKKFNYLCFYLFFVEIKFHCTVSQKIRLVGLEWLNQLSSLLGTQRSPVQLPAEK